MLQVCRVKFRSREDAGEALADRLAKVEGHGGPVLILGIPRGGVILADVVSRRLAAGFDIVIPRKLGAPGNEELAVGAVMEDGTEYINRYLMTALRLQPEYLEQEKARQAEEIRRRSVAYRTPGMPYHIQGKTVVLVDDGIATGATAIAAARWIRKQKPDTLIIAVPVAPAQTVEALRHEADAVIVLITPRDFGAVGEFYEEFQPVTDEQVIAIMREKGLL